MPSVKPRIWPLCLALLLFAAPALAEQARPPVAAELDALAAWVAQHKGRLSAVFVEAGSGRVLASSGADQSLNPASNAKLFTIAAALSRLGPEHRFTTSIHGRIENGAARRIVLRGDGDPSLEVADLAELARELARLGLTRVDGGIWVDQSRFDDRFVPPAFDQQPDEWAAFRAPVSAVALDKNSFGVRVEPTTAGKPARVTVEPPGFVALDSEARTDMPGKGRRLSAKLAAGKPDVSVKLSGHIAEDASPVSFRKRVDDPRLYAGYVFRALLKRQGVAVNGAVREGGRDEKNVLVDKKSEPLRVLLSELGKNSDNFTAETLLKVLSAETSGGAGSSSDGARVVSGWLAGVGAKDPGTVVTNGSGLFDANRVSASTLVTALRAARRDPKSGDAFLDQLAIGGVDGTLKGRFRSKLTKRRVRAKTGTLARAHSLAGFWVAPDGKKSLAFAVLVNGIAGKSEEQRSRIDRLVETAARGK